MGWEVFFQRREDSLDTKLRVLGPEGSDPNKARAGFKGLCSQAAVSSSLVSGSAGPNKGN